MARQNIFRGDRLEKMRNERGLTQDELESRLKLGNTSVYRYEKGKSVPTAAVIAGLAQELDITADYLLGLVNEPNEHLKEADLSAVERKLLSAFRRGDFRPRRLSCH